jgi:hypothetical protein
MKTKKESQEIKSYAWHYILPITDIKGFNQLLNEHGFKSVRRETVRKLLNY